MKTLFINVLKKCNLDCKQCYLSVDSRQSDKVLSCETLRDFISNPAFSDNNYRVVWQGGELSILPSSHLWLLSEHLPPGVKQSVVTNFLAYSAGLSDFVSSQCDRTIETTFAYQDKSTKSGSCERYRSCFLNTAKRYYDDGLAININVELNAGTIDSGVENLVRFFDQLPPSSIDFDISLSPIQNQELVQTNDSYLPKSVSFESHWQFLKNLFISLSERKLVNKSFPLFESILSGKTTQFSANSYGLFFTLSPDGLVTTNPLYSDQPGLVIGHSSAGSDFRESNRYKSLLREEYNRFCQCSGCPYVKSCGAGASYVPVYDGSGECVGGQGLRKELTDGALSA
tara:strand:+ start:5177 stop:6202 length:1026 start_codon:yes stop_codon:yes gene_type:complete